METFTQRLSLFTFEYDQAMRNAILVEEIIQLMSKQLITLRQYPHSSEFAVPAYPRRRMIKASTIVLLTSGISAKARRSSTAGT